MDIGASPESGHSDKASCKISEVEVGDVLAFSSSEAANERLLKGSRDVYEANLWLYAYGCLIQVGARLKVLLGSPELAMDSSSCWPQS